MPDHEQTVQPQQATALALVIAVVQPELLPGLGVETGQLSAREAIDPIVDGDRRGEIAP